MNSILEKPSLKTETKRKKSQSKYSVLSLFSGCGGLDLGFCGNFKYRHMNFPSNSFKIVFANDIDPAAKRVYELNKKYFNHNLINDDVKNITENDIPDYDILLAGFPCQPFSNAGQRKGVHDARGTLYQECERILKIGLNRKNKPKAFIFENVRGIISSNMPDGTSVPDEIVKLTKSLGYKTTYKLINASNYGVPSNRYRLLIVGVKKELGEFDFSLLDKVVADYNIPSAKINPYELYLGSIISDIPSDAPQYSVYWKLSPSGQYMVDKIGPCIDAVEAISSFKNKKPLYKISDTISIGRSWKNMNPADMSPRFRKIWDNPKKYRAPNFYRRFALGEINGTITASAQPENCGIVHPFYNRRFTIREIARIQSFPDDFIFNYSTIADAYKVIGNAVPPILGWVIAKSLDIFLGGKN